MKEFISQKLCCKGRMIAMVIPMLLGGNLCHAMEVPTREMPVNVPMLRSTNCFGEGFLYPFVEDEQEYERIKNNSYSYPFTWTTTYETLDKDPFLFKIARNSGFLEVCRRTSLKNTFPDDGQLWSEQQEFLKDMNLEKLAKFWPEMKIGIDKEGGIFSHSYYKSYIFHSKEFKRNKQSIPCLIGSNQVDESFVLGKLHELQILYDYQYRILKKHHYQFSFYHLYDPSKETQYIFWIEAYNPKIPSNCVLDQITIRKIQNLYYSSILDIIKNIPNEPKCLSDMGDANDISKKHAEIFLEMPVEFLFEMQATITEIKEFAEDYPKSDNTNDLNTSSDLVIAVIEDHAEKTSERILSEESSPKPQARRRSLSSYVTRTVRFKNKVKPLDLPINNYDSLSTPSSPTTSPHDYKTGLTPKSAPTSGNRRLSETRVSIKDPEFIRKTNNSGDSEEYQEILEDLKLVEKQRELIDKQHEKLIQKLRVHEISLETINSSPRNLAFRSSSPADLSPGNLSSQNSSGQLKDQTEVLWNSTSTIGSPKTSLREKRTKSADQYSQSASPQRRIILKGKSASPRSKHSNLKSDEKVEGS